MQNINNIKKNNQLATSLLLAVSTIISIFVVICCNGTVFPHQVALIVLLILNISMGALSLYLGCNILNFFLVATLLSPILAGYIVRDSTAIPYTIFYSVALLLTAILIIWRNDFSHLVVATILTVIFHNISLLDSPDGINGWTFLGPFVAMTVSSMLYFCCGNFSIVAPLFQFLTATYTVGYLWFTKLGVGYILSATIVIAICVLIETLLWRKSKFTNKNEHGTNLDNKKI